MSKPMRKPGVRCENCGCTNEYPTLVDGTCRLCGAQIATLKFTARQLAEHDARNLLQLLVIVHGFNSERAKDAVKDVADWLARRDQKRSGK